MEICITCEVSCTNKQKLYPPTLLCYLPLPVLFFFGFCLFLSFCLGCYHNIMCNISPLNLMSLSIFFSLLLSCSPSGCWKKNVHIHVPVSARAGGGGHLYICWHFSNKQFRFHQLIRAPLTKLKYNSWEWQQVLFDLALYSTNATMANLGQFWGYKWPAIFFFFIGPYRSL